MRSLRTRAGLAAALISALAPSMARTEAADTPLEAFVAKLEQAAQTEDFIGLAVAVVAEGEVALLRTYGVTEFDGEAPVTPMTAFPIASVSKGFASTLAGLLAAEGKLSYDDPVAAYAPGFKLKNESADRKATIDTVMSHRTGLPPNAYDNLLEAHIPVKEIQQRLSGVATVCRLNDCYTYQNVTYNLLAPVIETLDARPYADALDARLFDPLEMAQASVGYRALTDSDDWARPHSRRRKTHPWRTTKVTSAYYETPAAGGVNATIVDMAIWLRAQMGYVETVLPASVLSDLHAPRIASPRETRRWRRLNGRIAKTHYGYGWRIYDYAGHTAIAHSGGIRGYRAQIAFLPEQEIGLVAMWNSTGSRGFGLMPTLFDAYLGLEDGDWLKLEEDEDTPVSGG